MAIPQNGQQFAKQTGTTMQSTPCAKLEFASSPKCLQRLLCCGPIVKMRHTVLKTALRSDTLEQCTGAHTKVHGPGIDTSLPRAQPRSGVHLLPGGRGPDRPV
eukprot:scaffold108227_cov35-Prasinocladus_malaysianus.AAC.1